MGLPTRGDHSSGTDITIRLKQSTRTTTRSRPGRKRPVIPIRFCSWWGLPCRSHCCLRGALLPHHFTLTIPGPSLIQKVLRRFWGRAKRGGLFSVALSLRSPSPDVIRHHFSVEPGLSSLLRKRPPDRLEGLHRTQNGEPVNGIRNRASLLLKYKAMRCLQ